MNFTKVLERTANIAILVVAILLSATLLRNLVFKGHTNLSEIKVGDPVSVPGVTGDGRRMLLVALSTNCRFCTESAPFYQELLRRASGVRIIAVLQQPRSESGPYLQALNLNFPEVYKTSFKTLHVTGTPTLLLLDKRGLVANYWKGKLPPNGEKEVFQNISCQGSPCDKGE